MTQPLQKIELVEKRNIHFMHVLLFVLYIALIEDVVTFSLLFVGIPSLWTDYISQILFLLVFVILVIDFMIYKRIIKPTILMVGFVTILFLVSYRNYQNFQGFIGDSYITFFTNAVLVFYLATNIKQFNDFFEHMKPVILFSIVYMLIVFISSRTLGIYADMNIAYGILPATLASLVLAYREKNIKYYLYFALFAIMLFVLGNRGTILILVLFSVSFTLMKSGNFDIKSFVGPIILISGLLFLTFMIVDNLNMLDSLRLFSILSDKSFFQDSIRLKIWTDGFNYVFSNPLAINGALFDRIFYVLKYSYTHDVGFYVDETMVAGLYAHNVLVEMLLTLGFVLGGILFLYLIYNILKLLWINKFKIEFALFTVSVGFIHLMYSNSFLISIWFWFMIGVIYSIFKNESLKD